MGNFIGWCGGSSSKPTDVVLEKYLTPSSSSSGTTTTTTTTTTMTTSGNGSGYSCGYGDDPHSPSLTVKSTPSGVILEQPNLVVFSFAELKSATKNFRPEMLLGEGGFGRVYKGWIDHDKLASTTALAPAAFSTCSSKCSSSKLAVAIKKLSSESVQGFEEWQSEVNFLGRLSHPNLVKLLGYCWEEKELLLVYEYLPKGSLENHLFRRNTSMEPLSWDRRISIALGVARGLSFLHNSEKQIIYRDFKASNVLLDVNYDAKISDFGLAKLGPSGGNSHVTTRIMGTCGYAAPEYVATGHLYVNSDVYGYGVVLLEMLTGLRALDMSRAKGQQNLLEWAKPSLCNKGKLKNIVDARLEGQYSIKAAFELAQLTVKCLGPDPKARPCMKEVVQVLEKIEVKPKGCARKDFKQSSYNRRRPKYSHHNGPIMRASRECIAVTKL